MSRSTLVLGAAMGLLFVPTASADTFGVDVNQFTIDFVPISGSTNPTSGYGIVNNDYRMGRFEITNDQWNKFQASYGTVAGNPAYAYDESPYFTNTIVPVNEVSWYEAAQFVNWLNTSTGHHVAYRFTGTQGTGDYAFATWSSEEADGGTNLFRHKDAFYYLPTDDEWVKAAYWDGTTLQSYATKAGEFLTQGNGSTGTGWNYWSGGYATDPPGPWNVGSGSEEVNGTHDMMGNVWEWLESPYYSGTDYGAGSLPALRGGSFDGLDEYLTSFRINLDRGYEGNSYGFRVASEVPEPTTVLLLALSSLAVMRRRVRRYGLTITPAIVAALLLSATSARALDIETVMVGNAGNAGEWSGHGYGGWGPDRICGAVDYTYRIGKYEITAGQYCEFLNAVAQMDTYGLYHAQMDYDAYPDSRGCNIKRSGEAGNYSYTVDPNWARRPVNYVTWGDAARFCNWLANGQPTGSQDLTTTEDASYYLNGSTSNEALLAVTRTANAKWVIPSEDEWYKAAYYDPAKPGGPGYWNYPTGSDDVPSNVLDANGTNNVNYLQAAYTLGSPYYRTEVGAFANSCGPYGTFDQGGNVREWNEGVGYYGPHRGLRGGSFDDLHNQPLAVERDAAPPEWGLSFVGFRVAYVPEPASLLLLALGGLAVMQKWRRTAAR